jgi:hypothetical protein
MIAFSIFGGLGVMTNRKRFREVISGLPDRESLQAKMDEGWKPVAIEWEREENEVGTEKGRLRHEVPYGLMVSEDCLHLEENPKEMEILKLMLALIAGDHPLSKIAEELNHKDYRMRNGAKWTQVSAFYMLPRLIEVAPNIMSDDEWSSSKQRILRAV